MERKYTSMRCGLASAGVNGPGPEDRQPESSSDTSLVVGGMSYQYAENLRLWCSLHLQTRDSKYLQDLPLPGSFRCPRLALSSCESAGDLTEAGVTQENLWWWALFRWLEVNQHSVWWLNEDKRRPHLMIRSHFIHSAGFSKVWNGTVMSWGRGCVGGLPLCSVGCMLVSYLTLT